LAQPPRTYVEGEGRRLSGDIRALERERRPASVRGAADRIGITAFTRAMMAAFEGMQFKFVVGISPRRALCE
jgi:hypothetical protein